METINKSETFSLIKRAKSFTHAGRGLYIFLKTTHNAWIHCVLFCSVIALGFFFNITRFEWVSLIFAGGLVLVSEAFNTAIEIDIDLTSPQYHPYAKDTKDVAAGAVLIAACIAASIGIVIFAPYIFNI